MDNRVEWILKRRKIAETRKLNWQSILQKTYRLSQPNRNVFDVRSIGAGDYTIDIQGMDIQWYVFDLTLAHATDVFVNRMVNALVPAGKEWLSFQPGQEVEDIVKDMPNVREGYQTLTKKFFSVIHQSNFQSIIHECFMDMAVSTGFLTINEGYDANTPVIFASNPPDAIYADEGVYGTFDAFYRDWNKLPVTHAEEMWPDFKVPPQVNEKGDVVLELNLYEILYKDHKAKNYKYLVIHKETNFVCFERTDKTSCFVGFRVKKLSGETYGRGPSMDAVSAAATINHAMYDEIVSANFSALPMWMGFDDGVFNPHNFKMIPNTILACAGTAAGTWPLQPIPSGGSIQWGQLVIQDLRDQINKILLTDPFGPVDDPKKTATEIIERQRQILENASAQFSRLQRELFDPLVERVLDIMRKRGLWTDIEVDGKVLSIKYNTPLVTSEGQKKVLDLIQHAQFLQNIYPPEAISGFYNTELLSPWAAEMLNIELSVVKNTEMIMAAMEQAEEQKQVMNEQQQAQA